MLEWNLQETDEKSQSLELSCTLAVQEVQNESVFSNNMSVSFLQNLQVILFPSLMLRKGRVSHNYSAFNSNFMTCGLCLMPIRVKIHWETFTLADMASNSCMAAWGACGSSQPLVQWISCCCPQHIIRCNGHASTRLKGLVLLIFLIVSYGMEYHTKIKLKVTSSVHLVQLAVPRQDHL